MLHKSNFSIGAAVANQSGAMEADTISKNGRSSKSHTSRGIFLKLIVFFIAVCASVEAWGQVYRFEVETTLKSIPVKFTYIIDISSGEISLINTLISDPDVSSERSKFKIMGRVNFEGNGIGFIVENISKSKREDNNINQFVIYENRIRLENTATGSVYGPDFKSGDGNAAVFRKLRQEQFSGNTTTTPSTTNSQTQSSSTSTTTNSQPPSGEIEKVWLEHNIIDQYGQEGMFIHVQFTANNVIGKDPCLMYNFVFQGKTITFRIEEIKPSSNIAEYKDFVYFFSYKHINNSYLSQFTNAKNVEMELSVSLILRGDFISLANKRITFTLNR